MVMMWSCPSKVVLHLHLMMLCDSFNYILGYWRCFVPGGTWKAWLNEEWRMSNIGVLGFLSQTFFWKTLLHPIWTESGKSAAYWEAWDVTAPRVPSMGLVASVAPVQPQHSLREHRTKSFCGRWIPSWLSMCLGIRLTFSWPGSPIQKHLERKRVSSPITLGSFFHAVIPILQACSWNPYYLTLGKYTNLVS